MIVKIHGILSGVEKDQALVEVNGLTYGVLISKAVAAELVTTGVVGKDMTLHTISYIEGNPGMGNLTPRLVGFPDKTFTSNTIKACFPFQKFVVLTKK